MKIFIWWLARKTQEEADKNPMDVWLHALYGIFLMVRLVCKPTSAQKRNIHTHAHLHTLAEDTVLSLLAVCAYGLQKSIEIQDRAGPVLLEGEAKQVADCMRLHLRSYIELAGIHYRSGRMMYKIRHKIHYLTHAVDDIFFYRLNQKLFHTFEEESFLGKLKAIGTRCHGSTMCSRIFQRYLLCIAVCLEEHGKLAVRMG